MTAEQSPTVGSSARKSFAFQKRKIPGARAVSALLSDTLKDDACTAIEELKALNINNIQILSIFKAFSSSMAVQASKS